MSQRNDESLPVFRAAMFSDIESSEGTQSVEGGAPPASPTGPPSVEQRILMGPNGIRAGWRLLIFGAIVFVLLAVYGLVLLAVSGQKSPSFTPKGVILGEAAVFLSLLIASWIMGRIEKRTIGDYGLPIREALGKNFWEAAVIGFIAMTVLLGILRAVGVFSFGSITLHGASVAHYAVLWGLAFLLVGFSEEYMFRGYAQFTLTTGMGFWPAAILLSVGFGAVHLFNSGEDWLGAVSVVASGLFLCFLLRRSGSLWMPVGFHLGWDWAQTFFYGVPDSGIVAPGHLFHPAFHGTKILTGGSVGPEGSILCFVVLALCWIFFHFWLPEAKYPSPEALGKRPHLE